MRKLILCLAVMTGAGAFATVAGAAPLPQAPIAFVSGHVQTVQYHDRGWRERQEMRRQAEIRRREELRRREAFRRAHHHDRRRGESIIRH